jgi:hypothetical protein
MNYVRCVDILIKTNSDYIEARELRLSSAKEELEEKHKEYERLIYEKADKTKLFRAGQLINLAQRIVNNCLDDIAWLKQYPYNGKQWKLINYAEDEFNIEITKHFRLFKEMVIDKYEL